MANPPDTRTICVIFLLLNLANVLNGEFQENLLNVPQILLPFVPKGSTPTNFTLRAMKGCFKWTSTRPEIATVKPILSGKRQGHTDEDECARSAVVTAQSISSSKETTVVIAEEEVSGLTLRCDVFVDVIWRIEIATTTRELLLGENPEVFDVYGYDEEGNLFSALGRLKFKWNLLPVSEDDSLDPASILKFLWFKDSSYETTPEIYDVESQALRGSSILVEGINTGEAIVSAKLEHPAYKDTAPSMVKLTVIDNIILLPSSDAYILAGTSVNYRVMQLRRGRPKEITMPSSQYQLTVENDNIATLDPLKTRVTGVKLGTTKVVLIDKNMANTKTMRQPSATIHVVEPGKITFSIRPGNIWTLETGRQYAIRVHVYDKTGHEILITDNSILSSTLNAEYFEAKMKTLNESYFVAKTLKSGVVNIYSLLLGVKIEETGEILNLSSPVRGDQDVMICDPIVVTPAQVVIPWDPSLSADAHYQVVFTASGGCGSYIWSSMSDKIASVNSKGLVTSNNVIGSSEIKATDVKNTAHSGSSLVHVLPPHEMHFVLGQVEAQVGSMLFLPLSVAAFVDKEQKELVLFKDCSRLKLDIAFSNVNIFKVVDNHKSGNKLPDDACTGIVVEAVSVGFAMVTASYNSAEGPELKATITIGSYPPLKVIDPVDTASVTLASMRDIVLQGGPQPWVLDMTGYFEQMSSEEDEWVSISSPETSTRIGDREGSFHVFKVLCKQLGEQMLTVHVGNRPTAKNIKPASSVVTVRYSCVPPSSIQLKPVITYPVIDGHQMTIESCQDPDKQIPVRNDRELLIVLAVRDASGLPISNATSLDVKWSTSNPSLAKLISKQDQLHQLQDFKETVTAHQMVLLSERQGSVTLVAKVSSYKKIFLYAAGVFQEVEVSPSISGSLNLVLVPEARLDPPSLTLLSHPQNKVKLNIHGGSRHFVIKSNSNDYASIERFGKSDLLVSPLSTGNLVVTVHDTCLDATQPAKAVVNLEAIHKINVVVPDKVELSKTIKAVVQVFDANGKALSVVDMSLLHLTPRLSLDIMHVRYVPETEKLLLYNRAVYSLKGLAVGVTSLTYHITEHEGIDISSHPEDIQVFPPLRLNPRHLVLLSGATFQVQSHGGPRPQSTTVFSIQNETVATVNTAGLVTAYVPGVSGLKGMAQGHDPHSGQVIVYSEDKITVEVIKIKGFKIFVASRNVVSGSQIGIYAVGINDEGPFTFASSPPYLHFRWSSSNVDVANLKSVYSKTGVTVETEKDFRVTLNSVNPGQTAIRLKVEVAEGYADRIHPGAIMEDEVQIQVFEELRLAFPENGQLLLPHGVTTRLKTNRDGLARLTYQTITGCGAANSEPVVTINSNGEVNSLTSSGNVAVLVTSHEDFGFNQSVVIHIEVRPIASISLRSMSLTRASLDKMHAFPLGTTAEFGLSLHDNVGRKFDVTNVPLEHRIHRLDAINVIRGINNGTFSIKMASIGEAILKVYYKSNPQIADYVRIRVDYGIQPAHPSSQLGAMSCFHLTTKCVECKQGSWHSSSPHILSVDSETGVALSNAAGSAIVYYTVPGVVTTYVEASVKDTTNLHLSSDVPFLTNIIATGRPVYDFEVTFGDTGDSIVNCNGTFSKNIGLFKAPLDFPSECRISTSHPSMSGVSITDVFKIEAKYVNGKLFCEVRVRDIAPQAVQPLFGDNIVALVQAVVKDSQREIEVNSNLVQVNFVPAFVLSHNTVTLLDIKSKDLVTVIGSEEQLQQLEILIDSPTLLQVNKMREDLPTKNIYEVLLPSDVARSSYSSSPLSVVFRSPITGQTEEISVLVQLPPLPAINTVLPNCTALPVKTENKMSQFFHTFSDSTSWLIIFSIMVATMILILFCYHNFATRHRDKYPFYSQELTPPPPYHTPVTQYRTAGNSPPPYHRSPGGTSPPRTLFSVSQ